MALRQQITLSNKGGLMEHGKIVPMQMPEPKTLRELSQQSVNKAKSRLECAQVEYDAAVERLRMIEEKHPDPDRPLTK